MLTLLLQLEDAIHQGFAGWRTSWHVDIDGNDPVTASDHAVAVVVVSTSVGTATHTDDPSGIRHLIVNLSEGRGHLVCERACHDHHITLSRGGTENDPQTILVVPRCRKVHHLHGAAGETERQGPQRALSRPVGDLVECGKGILHSTFLLLLRCEGHFATQATSDREAIWIIRRRGRRDCRGGGFLRG